jgi:hypothetical protein
MNPTAPSGLLWLADCALLIRNSEPALDWERLIEQARRCRLALPMRAALGWLREHVEESIPEDVIARLERMPAPLGERIDYYLASRPDEKRRGVGFKAAAAASRYLGMRPGQRLAQLRRDLPHWLRVLMRPMAR